MNARNKALAECEQSVWYFPGRLLAREESPLEIPGFYQPLWMNKVSMVMRIPIESPEVFARNEPRMLNRWPYTWAIRRALRAVRIS